MSIILCIAVVILGIMLADTRSRMTGLAWRIYHLEEWRQSQGQQMEAQAAPMARPETVAESAPMPATPVAAPPEPVPDIVWWQEPPEPVEALANVVPGTLRQPDAVMSDATETTTAFHEDTPPAARHDTIKHDTIEQDTARHDTAGPAKSPARSFAGFEDLFGRRLPIWAGGITLAIAGILIVRYAIDIGVFRRIFTPPMQVICGLLFGSGLIAGAEWAHAKADRVADPRVAQALSGAGVSTLYAAVLVAVNAYHLIDPLTGFIALAGVTAAALGLSLRHGIPSALLGLVGGLAAPALTVGMDQHVPMLAVYLGLTITALAGVARMQRWPWLTLASLVAGGGWSLWIILSGVLSGVAGVSDVTGVLALGGFILWLAIAMPALSLSQTHDGLLRIVLQGAGAAIGAVQLALLVATGGFQPLHWGLFALIAAAGQWLAWRERNLAMLPAIGAALAIVLLAIWPHPERSWLLGVGAALAAIHLLPLYARLWSRPQLHRAVELAAIAAAIPFIAWVHHDALPGPDAFAFSALAGAMLTGLAAALGWQVQGREEDQRLALLLGTGAALATLAAWAAFPLWQIPLWTGAGAAVLLILAPLARDRRIEPLAAAFAAIALALLGLTALDSTQPVELLALVGLNTAPAHGAAWLAWIKLHQAGLGWSCLRWAGLAALSLGFALRARQAWLREVGQALAVLLAYGTLAQILPAPVLSLSAPVAALIFALSGSIGSGSMGSGRSWAWPAQRGAGMVLAALTFGWMAQPLIDWMVKAELAMIGMPMVIAPQMLPEELRGLLAPALLWGGALAALWTRLPHPVRRPAALIAATLAAIGLHCLYRILFAGLFGDDFALTGLAERLIWCGLLIGAGLAMAQRKETRALASLPVACAALHLIWFSLLLHDPLWSRQAVGPWPLANLLAPLCIGLPLCLLLLERMRSDEAWLLARLRQPVTMAMVALFGWASLRQAFHGTWLIAPGLGSAEDILRSLLGVVLAIGFLLYGIKARRREWRLTSLGLMLTAVGKVFLFDASGLDGLWRIGSFIALGLSLIGIGWLYSRQLRADTVEEG